MMGIRSACGPAVALAALLLAAPAWGGPAEQPVSLSSGTVVHTTLNAVLNLRAIDVPGSTTELLVWEELQADGQVTPYFAVSFDGRTADRVTATSYDLKLRHGEFDPLTDVPAPKAGLAADESCNLYLVQFWTQPLEEFRQQITMLGGTVRVFVANHAHVVQMGPAVRDVVATLPYVRWIGPLHPAYRLDEAMIDHWAQRDELFPWQRYNIEVFEPEFKPVVAARIAAIGGTVDGPDAGKCLVFATLTPAQLAQVAGWNEVSFVDPWAPDEDDMDIARQLGGANYIYSQGGYTGLGLRGEVFDSGFNLTHVDFQHHPFILHTQVNTASHGASTSGICFGDGTGNPQAKGMLPEGQGVVACYSYVNWEGGGRYAHIGQTVNDYQCVFTTCSFGSSQTVAYTTISAEMDRALFDFDHAHTQSQSNTGNQTSRPQAWAKNIISGGALYHYNTLTMNDDMWNGGASIGPATDGRIKPDLCAFYDQILTTTTGSTTAYTTNFGGTSGATPIIAGHLGLFFQMWADGIFGNPVNPSGTIFENRAHMTTAKAMLINHATQYPFSGTSHDKSRFKQGWGWPNLQRMYDMRHTTLIVNETDILQNLQTKTYYVTVPSGEPELRVTMTYADPAGTPLSNQHRINDLTLKVTAPGGAVYWGNVGLKEANYSTVGGSADTKDTVECVYVLNPTPDVWTIQVIASEINQDSHVETPEVDADYALVVSGVQLYMLGDLNCDGHFDFGDINPFVLALTNPARYAIVYPNCNIMAGDINRDGRVDFGDINPFVGMIPPQ